MAKSPGANKQKEKVTSPSTHFARPGDVLADPELSKSEKTSALATWEQDSRQLMTASNEGMPGKAEGLRRDDHHRLGHVQRAKAKIGASPAEKPSH
jgi:hypothetical protein